MISSVARIAISSSIVPATSAIGMISIPLASATRAAVRRSIATRGVATHAHPEHIISTAAQPDVQANDVSHFNSFKEYRAFAQQFGPLASHAWERDISNYSTDASANAHNLGSSIQSKVELK